MNGAKFEDHGFYVQNGVTYKARHWYKMNGQYSATWGTTYDGTETCLDEECARPATVYEISEWHSKKVSLCQSRVKERQLLFDLAKSELDKAIRDSH